MCLWERRSRMASELPAQAGRRTLARRMYGLIALSALALGAILFIPAGTLAYWEAWLYLAVLLIPTFFVLRYLLEHNPQLLARRMEMREREVSQRRIINFASLYFLLVFILPGLDERWGWSGVPSALV